MKTKQYAIIIIVIIVCYLIYYETYRMKNMREEFDFKDLMKENYIVKENFLNESEFKVLQEKIANVPLDENPLSYGFKNSYGKVFCFSLFDIGEKLDFYQMEFLEPLIQSILNPNANYFIFNIGTVFKLNTLLKIHSKPINRFIIVFIILIDYKSFKVSCYSSRNPNI